MSVSIKIRSQMVDVEADTLLKVLRYVVDNYVVKSDIIECDERAEAINDVISRYVRIVLESANYEGEANESNIR